MTLWYLRCSITLEYAVVYAYNEKEAFKKLNEKRNLQETDYKNWTVEEFNPYKYDGVLYFS